MLLSLAYLVVRMLLRLLVPNSQGEVAKDLEIVVLRHELGVLRRQSKRPSLRPSDRAFSGRCGSTTATNWLGALLRVAKDAAALAPGAGRLQVGSIRQASCGQGRRCRQRCRS